MRGGKTKALTRTQSSAKSREVGLPECGFWESATCKETLVPSLKLKFHRIIIVMAASTQVLLTPRGRSTMESIQRFTEEITWTATEKKTARRAFDKAFERHCVTVTAEARRMLENVTAPSDVWRVQEYLSERRKVVDRIYDYRYSQLLLVFSILMRDGWLTEKDLTGLQQEKIARIKVGAKLFNR